MKSGAVLTLLAWLAGAPALAAQAGEPFVTPLTLDEMSGKQAVFETDRGTITIDLRPDLAPNHVGLVMRLAGEGHFDGTTFHRMVRHGIVQGGDPLTADPERAAEYGRGGLGLVDAEFSDARHVRGAVSAVLAPGQPGSGGSQFFICVVDQPGLDGRHTIWGQVADGMDIVTRISETPVDAEGRAAERVAVRRGDHPRQAAARGPAVHDGDRRGAGGLPGRARHHSRAHRHRPVSGPRPEPRPQLSAARRRRRPRRHRVPPRRARLRHPERPPADPPRAAHRPPAAVSCGTCSRSSATRRTYAASSRWRGSTIRRARRPPSSFAPPPPGPGRRLHRVRGRRGRARRGRPDRGRADRGGAPVDRVEIIDAEVVRR